MNGGATSPTVEVYQCESGYCRVYWYAFDQDGSVRETIGTFREKNWSKAIERAVGMLVEFAKSNGGTISATLASHEATARDRQVTARQISDAFRKGVKGR